MSYLDCTIATCKIAVFDFELADYALPLSLVREEVGLIHEPRHTDQGSLLMAALLPLTLNGSSPSSHS